MILNGVYSDLSYLGRVSHGPRVVVMACPGTNALTRQCIGSRRIGELKSLQGRTGAWSNDVNVTPRGVDWQMKIDDARCKLNSVYRKLSSDKAVV